MKRLLATVSMALALVVAVAVSAYCASASGQFSRLVPDFHRSYAKPSRIVLAQAKTDSPEQPSKDRGAQTVVHDVVLEPIAEGPQTAGTPGSAALGTPGTGDPVPGCTNGKAVGNKHCVATPSE